MKPAQSISNKSNGQAGGIPAQGLRILVVEDNSLAQALTIFQLEKMGYRAEGAADGMEALDVLQQQEYDVIFMDLNMPRLGGLEATRLIRRQESDAGQPYIIALTANSRIGSQEQCLEAGMNDFLDKPATRQQMELALLRAVNGRSKTG